MANSMEILTKDVKTSDGKGHPPPSPGVTTGKGGGNSGNTGGGSTKKP